MKKINVNMFPKDGYYFSEKDGTVIRASSWKGVIARVAGYRRRNKLPEGDPALEVNQQACEKNPSYCQEESDVTKIALKVASLKGRVLAWAARLRRTRDQLLIGDETNMRARANVCAGCPAHTSIAGGCGSCKKALREVRLDLLGDRPIDPRLAGCSILGEDTAISTWIDQTTVDNPDLPGCCWRRRAPPG